MLKQSKGSLGGRLRPQASALLCTLLFALALPWPSDPVEAAGLGRLTVGSAQGQPFKAEIDLVAVKKDEKPILTARLASQEAFREASVDYLPLLSTFYASIETRANGSPYVRIISPQPVSEPLLNILVELNWPSGRLLREYTVVLPQPENDGNSAKQAAKGSSGPGAKGELAVDKGNAAIGHDERQQAPEADPASSSVSGSRSYGPVKQGDTLAGIAKNIIGSDAGAGASLNQALIALHRANPGAFIGGNIHQLRAGATLRIPDRAEIRAVTTVDADKSVQLQTADWRQRKLGAVPEVPVELRQTVTGTIDRAPEPEASSAREPAREVLRLSKGAEAPQDQEASSSGAGTNGSVGTGDTHLSEHSRSSAQLQAMEEDATARGRALREANERITLLEKNIRELQRLLELKNVALAEMQKHAEDIQTNSGVGQSEGEIEGEIEDKRAQAEQRALAGNAAEAMYQQSLKNAEAPVFVPEIRVSQPAGSHSSTSNLSLSDPFFPERVELAKPGRLARLGNEVNRSSADGPIRGKDSFLDDLMVNFEYLGGALVLLLTGIVGVSMVRGSKSSSIFDHIDEAAAASAPAVPSASELKVIAEPVAGPVTSESGRLPESKGIPDSEPSPQPNPASTHPAAAEAGPETEVKPGTKLEPKPVPEPLVIRLSRSASKSESTEREPERDLHWHEMVTKLDLARAYQEMDDKESARQILQEVIREGDQQQREYASAILKRLQASF